MPAPDYDEAIVRDGAIGDGAPMAAATRATASSKDDGGEDRGAVRRRRVPDRDPVGEGLDGARDVAQARTSTRSRPAPSRCCGRTSRAASKFFVAKVDPKKVKMVDGHAALSPLRFHYDSEEFALPIRLGMANSAGKQDLIVNILSPDKRYEVANYKNVVHPDELRRQERRCKTRFAEFYAALFDKTVEANPGAVVTEYAWTATPQLPLRSVHRRRRRPTHDIDDARRRRRRRRRSRTATSC